MGDSDMKKFLNQLLKSVEGLLGILITDRDGVLVTKVVNSECPDVCSQPSFLATYSTVGEQVNKLNLGRNKSLISQYKDHQVIVLNKMPIIVTMIAKDTGNTGQILSLETDLELIMADLQAAVE